MANNHAAALTSAIHALEGEGAGTAGTGAAPAAPLRSAATAKTKRACTNASPCFVWLRGHARLMIYIGFHYNHCSGF